MKSIRPFTRQLAVIVLVVATTFSAAFAVDWNHDPGSPLGPSFWGELTPEFRTCGAIIPDFEGFQETGKKQTPIDIVNPMKAFLPALFPLYLDRPLVVENNGHVIEVPYEAEAGHHPSRLVVGLDVYDLVQFHFHAPSEHMVNGQEAAMELHLVHRDMLGDLAVVGILMEIGHNPNRLVDLIMEKAPEEEGEVPVGVSINAKALLPQSLNYYTYSGSLTTPPCTEGVRWFVLQEPVHVSAVAVERLHELIAQFPAYGGFPDNNRPVRPLNGRTILDRIGK